MRTIEEAADFCLVAKDLKPEGKYLCNARQTITLFRCQRLLVPPAAFQCRLRHHAVGEAPDIVRADAASDAVERRNRQSLLHGICESQRWLRLFGLKAQ